MHADSKKIELQPHLVGELLELRPLLPEHRDQLFAAASDPLIWEQHPVRNRYQEQVFQSYFQGGLDSKGAFAVIDRATGKIVGSTRYCDYVPERSEIEIGWTFLVRSHWGGNYNGEMKRLMLEHIFQFVDHVVFKIGETNLRSRKAVEKIGGVLIDRREKMEVSGVVVEHVWYRITKPA